MLSLAIVILYFGVTLAQSTQRPNNATICDWYAIQRYGENTTDSQGKLMQSVVALAFAGGENLKDINPEITGILNPGTFDNEPVDLLPWFNGSIRSTNLNNQAVQIDWLDDLSAPEALHAFLNGTTDTVQFGEKSNEFRLFAHFFRSFAFVFGCTQPPARPAGETGAPLSLAYVHKFMELNHTHLGHFINQLTLSAVHFGFSVQDSNTLETQMNARYNIRCLPAITLNPASGPQLFSLCQAESCPLAAPVADCDAYADLGPNGPSASSTGSSPVSSPSSPASSTTQIVSTTTTTTTAVTTTPATATSAPASSGPVLAAGPIAGIAIGGGALVLGFIALLVFLLRRRKPQQIVPFGGTGSNPSNSASPFPGSPYQGYAPSTADPRMSYVENPKPHQAELWTAPVEIGSGEDSRQEGQKSKVL